MTAAGNRIRPSEENELCSSDSYPLRTSSDSRAILSSSRVRRNPYLRTICDKHKNETAAMAVSAICTSSSNGCRCCESQSGHDMEVRFTKGTTNVNKRNTIQEKSILGFVDWSRPNHRSPFRKYRNSSHGWDSIRLYIDLRFGSSIPTQCS